MLVPMTIATAPAVPRFDLAPVLAGDSRARAELVAAIDRACREIGFFTITGHGIDAGLIEEVRRLTSQFFALPDAVKARYASVTGNEFRGWSVRDAVSSAADGGVRCASGSSSR